VQVVVQNEADLEYLTGRKSARKLERSTCMDASFAALQPCSLCAAFLQPWEYLNSHQVQSWETPLARYL
jgi:hypothetical protein